MVVALDAIGTSKQIASVSERQVPPIPDHGSSCSQHGVWGGVFGSVGSDVSPSIVWDSGGTNQTMTQIGTFAAPVRRATVPIDEYQQWLTPYSLYGKSL